MIVTVQLDGVDYDVPLPVGDDRFTVGALKQLLESRSNISAVRQKMLFNTTKGGAIILRDSQILVDIGVGHGSRLNVVLLPADTSDIARQRERERNMMEESGYGDWQNATDKAILPLMKASSSNLISTIPQSTTAQTASRLPGDVLMEQEVSTTKIKENSTPRDFGDRQSLVRHACAALDRLHSHLDQVPGTMEQSNPVSLEGLLRRHFAALYSLQLPVLELYEEYRAAKMSEATSAVVAAANPAADLILSRSREENRRLNATQLAQNAKRMSAALSSFAVASTDLSLLLSRLYSDLMLEDSSGALIDELDSKTREAADEVETRTSSAIEGLRDQQSTRDNFPNISGQSFERDTAKDMHALRASPSDQMIAETLVESAMVAQDLITGKTISLESGTVVDVTSPLTEKSEESEGNSHEDFEEGVSQKETESTTSNLTSVSTPVGDIQRIPDG